MGFENRTVKIIFIGAINFLVIAFAVGTVAGVHVLSAQGNSQIKLDFVPRPDRGTGDLIFYRLSDAVSLRYFYTKINDFLSEYKKKEVENRVACSFSSISSGNQVCDVPVEDFHPCTEANYYKFDRRGGPCVFLKLNKVLDWVPVPYNNTEELPEAMPMDLREHIKNTFQFNPNAANTVWLSCEGLTPTDKENIGPVQYIPRRDFPGFYYPFKDQKGYLSPLVAVMFERPMPTITLSLIRTELQ